MQQGPDEAKYTDTNPACDITWNSIRWFIQRAQTRTESIQSIKHGFALLFLFIFAYGSSVAPASFVQKTIFPPLNWFCTFVKNNFAIFVWMCFWALCSVPSIYASVLPPIPHCLDYCTSSLLFFYCHSPPMVLYIKYPGWRSHMLLT